jgi:hypothetical protein
MLSSLCLALCLCLHLDGAASAVVSLAQDGSRFSDTRSGNPNQVNTFTYVSAVTIPAQTTVTLRYKYVAGYCNHGTSATGAQFAVKIGGTQIPLMTAGPFSGSTVYPYDSGCGGCPTCYSPWIDLTGTTTAAMNGNLEVTFTNNGRNMHLVVDSISYQEHLGRSDVDIQDWNGANTITNTNPCTPDDDYANCGCEHASCSMQTHESLGRVIKVQRY